MTPDKALEQEALARSEGAVKGMIIHKIHRALSDVSHHDIDHTVVFANNLADSIYEGLKIVSTISEEQEKEECTCVDSFSVDCPTHSEDAKNYHAEGTIKDSCKSMAIKFLNWYVGALDNTDDIVEQEVAALGSAYSIEKLYDVWLEKYYEPCTTGRKVSEGT